MHPESNSDLSTVEIITNRGLCMAAGECAHHAPRTFAIGDDRRVTIVENWQTAGDTEDEIITAAASCPNFVIDVLRDGSPLT